MTVQLTLRQTAVVRESLELLVEKIRREEREVLERLEGIAERLGLRDWRELEDVFREEGPDNPELDLLWPEYMYLRGRLEDLEKRRREAEELLERLG